MQPFHSDPKLLCEPSRMNQVTFGGDNVAPLLVSIELQEILPERTGLLLYGSAVRNSFEFTMSICVCESSLNLAILSLIHKTVV